MTSYSQYFALKSFSNLDGRKGGGRTGGRTAPTLAPTRTTASTPTTTTTTTPRTTRHRPRPYPMPYPVPIYGGGYPIYPIYLEEENTPVVTVADVKESIKKEDAKKAEEAKKMIAPSPEGEGGGEKEKEKEITYIPIAVIAIGVLFLIFKPLKVK